MYKCTLVMYLKIYIQQNRLCRKHTMIHFYFCGNACSLLHGTEQCELGVRLVKFLHTIHCSSFAANVMQLHFHNGNVCAVKL